LIYNLIEFQWSKCLHCPGVGREISIGITPGGENAKIAYMFEQEEAENENNKNSIHESFGSKLNNIK
jgi:hypothetical protein